MFGRSSEISIRSDHENIDVFLSRKEKKNSSFDTNNSENNFSYFIIVISIL